MRVVAVLAASALAVMAAGCSSTSSDDSFTPAALATRPLPSIAAAKLPNLGKFTKRPDGTEVSTISSDFLFDLGSSTLLPAAATALKDLADQLENYPGKVQIVGYTDGIGSQDVNQTLSEKRAEAVKALLVQDGVDEAVLSILGKGSEGAQPGVADSARRMVEIILK